MPHPKTPKMPDAAMLASHAFDFGGLVDGVWCYREPQQQALVCAVQTTLAWDIQQFDAWLFGASHWRSYPRVRQRLIEIRRQLSTVWLAPATDESQRTVEIKKYFRATRQLSLRLENLPQNLRQSMLAVADVRPAPASTKLNAQHAARIHRLYREMVQSGQKYGALTKLARQYGVSLATIRKAINTGG